MVESIVSIFVDPLMARILGVIGVFRDASIANENDMVVGGGTHSSNMGVAHKSAVDPSTVESL